MPLKLVLGPANSAKAGAVLGAYGEATAHAPVLVVPTAEDAAHYGRELAERGVVVGGWVVTFAGLAGEIARRTGYSQRVMTALQRERVVRRVVAEARLRTLAQSAGAPGFARAVMALIAELERSLVTPRRFAAAMRAWAVTDEARTEYATEVSSLYLGYADQLERLDRVDAELFAWHALDALRGAPHAWGRSPVFFYGFDDLFALERDAIETLARVVDTEVTVSLTAEAGRYALAARAEAVQELRTLAAHVDDLPAADDYYEPGARAVLHHVERNMFEPGPHGRVDPGSAIELLESGGERAEAELVAAEVLALLKAGMRGEQIAIVHRSLEASAPLFERVLGAAGIPVAVKRELPIRHTALGRSLLALARCTLLGAERASAADLIEYLRAPGLLEHPEVADNLERAVRREALTSAAQAREKLGWRLAELDAIAAARNPLAELVRQAERLLAAPRLRQAATLDPREEPDAGAVAAVSSAVAQLEELGETPVGEDALELLESVSVTVGAGERPGAVLLAEPLAIRARRFRAVFVCGLQEGEFPRPGTGEPFLSDERRRELAAAAGLRLRAREDTQARERYLFYSCVSRPTERLFLSYRSSDEEGNLALPSPFVADVRELLTDSLTRRQRLLADVVWKEDEAPTERELARARAVRTPRSVGHPPERRLSEHALARVRHAEVLSAGGLECYADCPVKWLVEKELQPGSFDPEPDPITRGTYMHDVLERLLRRLGTAITPDRLADAARILDEILTEVAPAVAKGSAAPVREATLKTIRADLRRYIEQEASSECGWGQAGLELRFGFEEDEEDSLPALELGGELKLRGVIDRVDTNGSGQAIVRDYKTGRTNASHRGARWSEDRQLQVALYMVAVRELLGLEPVGGFYQQLGGDELRPRGMFLEGAEVGSAVFANDARDADQLRFALEDSVERALALARRLRAGELTPTPDTCSRDGCAYPGICRVLK